jgi:hypothetical protein
MITKLTAGALATTMLATQAWAGCMDVADKTALKIETLQQELMVAGLTCNAANPYNEFVLANRPELLASDHDLQSFYTKLYAAGGTAQYQAVKTRLANHFSLDSLHNQEGFCRTAAMLFSNMRAGTPLAQQVSWIAVNDTKESCERGGPIVETVAGGSGGLPRTQIARNDSPPQRDAREAQGDDNYGPPPPAERVAQNAPPPNYPQRGYYAPNPYWGPPPGYAPGYYPPPPPQYAPRGGW